ncbi:MAG: efflux RND transporter periplasmic adaptor subunit, partial [Chloroflexi bacterium]|nr:efflux RND transporter periplasmic adaptor subunit [Chloroflexota bacterium]
GDTVDVRFDALEGLEMTGTVMSISQFGEEKQGAITYTAQIRLNGHDDRLRWNMTSSFTKADGGSKLSLLR